jgi:hypothetical protein
MVRSKKRSIEVEDSERLKKKCRTDLLQSRNVTISNDSRNVSDNIDTQFSDTAVAVVNSVTPAVRRRNTSRRLISLPLRSERSINLFVRFRS